MIYAKANIHGHGLASYKISSSISRICGYPLETTIVLKVAISVTYIIVNSIRCLYYAHVLKFIGIDRSWLR